LFDVVTVGLGVDAPVNAFDVIAGHIRAVLGEIEGKADVRTFVHAGDVAIHELTGYKLNAPEFGECGGVQ